MNANGVMSDWPSDSELEREFCNVSSPESQSAPAARPPQQSQRRPTRSTLPFVPYEDWDPDQPYDEQPPTCMHYTMEWKLTLNRRTAAKQTENDLVIAPSSFWQEQLSSKVTAIVRLTGKPYEAEATTITMSVNDRSERDITKRFEKLHIDWSDVERQLQAWSHLLPIGKKLRISVALNYMETRAARTAGRGAGATQLAELNDQVDAEEAVLGGPVAWKNVYRIFRCPGPPCDNSQYCWIDSTDGNKHYPEGEIKSEEPCESGKNISHLEVNAVDNDQVQLRALNDQVEGFRICDADPPEPPSLDKIFQELMQDSSYRQTLFNSHCCLNKLNEVASLVEVYKDDAFISWRGSKGLNCIALAAIEGHDQMIRLLSDMGGDLNNVDSRGRTPLMEAALWGRLKTVETLLERGADPRAKDRKGRSAHFYSSPSRLTARMREEFGDVQEQSDAEANRRMITIKLQAFEPAIPGEERLCSHPPEVKPGYFKMETTGLTTHISYYEQCITYTVSDQWKTVARLERGELFSVMSATSGWRDDFTAEDLLGNRLWRDHVLILCQLLGYNLPEDDRNELGRPGSYNASHAEKKLVAYYISQHVILPSDVFEGFPVNQAGFWSQDLELQHLRSLCPNISRVPASIRASRVICRDCEHFISFIRNKFHLPLTVEGPS